MSCARKVDEAERGIDRLPSGKFRVRVTSRGETVSHLVETAAEARRVREEFVAALSGAARADNRADVARKAARLYVGTEAHGMSDASKTPRGWSRRQGGSRHVVVPLGRRGQRMSRCLATCTTDEQADARAEVVREIARLLAASGNAADIPKWVAVACDGDDVKALAVLGYARKLAAGQVAVMPSAPPARKKKLAGWKGKPENVCFGCWDLVAEMQQLRAEVAELRARLDAGETP